MRCKIVGATACFKISNTALYEYPPFKISNYSALTLIRLLDTDFGSSFGRHGINQFKEYEAFIYWEVGDDTVTDLDNASEQLNSYMATIRERFHVFDSFLWFVKDNSVNIHTVYAIAKNGNQLGQMSYESKVLTSTCLGKFEDTIFSKEELDACIKIREKFYQVCPDHKNEDHWGYGREVNRIEKAFKFLCAARSETYLPAKIAGYMSCLECLFSTDAEMKHFFAHFVERNIALYCAPKPKPDGQKNRRTGKGDCRHCFTPKTSSFEHL